MLTAIETARAHSLYLTRLLDNGQLNLDILNPLLSRPLTDD